MVSLQERLDEFKKSFESGAPPYKAPHEVIETMHRATAELKATGIEERALKVGDRAQGFSLFNQDHVQIDSADLLRQGAAGIQLFSRELVTLLLPTPATRLVASTLRGSRLLSLHQADEAETTSKS